MEKTYLSYKNYSKTKVSSVYVDYSNRARPTLTVLFTNLANYTIRIYEKNKILPLGNFQDNFQDYPLPLDLNSMLIYYSDGYGNESQALDISNWF